MGSNKIKIENVLVGSPVYLNCEGLSKDGRTIKIPARTEGKGIPFVFISEDELSWIMANSNIFAKGHVRVVETADLPESIKEELPKEQAISVNDIDAMFKLSAAKFKTTIGKIEREDLIKEMIKRAKDSDISTSLLKVLENRLGEILPKFDVSAEPVKED